MTRRSPLSLLLPLGLALLVPGLAGCGADADAGPDASRRAPDQVETLVVRPTAFEEVVELTGTVRAADDATLSAQAPGSIVSLVERGTVVRAGQAVAHVDPALSRAALAQAEAQQEAARAQLAVATDAFNRQEPLYRDSIVSPIEFQAVRAQRDAARAGLDQTRAAVVAAREQLRRTVVAAPFSGVVEAQLVERGEQVMPGTPVVRLVSAGNVLVAASVPERYAADVAVGGAAYVTFQAYGDARTAGRIRFVGTTVDPDTRTFEIEIDLPDTARRFKPQMVGTVYLPRAQRADALVAPEAALLPDPAGALAFVVQRRGGAVVAEQRRVVAGAAAGGRVVVESGLRPGDELVVSGQADLAPGDTVRVARRHTTLPAD